MAALRDPETGCPWDLDQNFSTIAPYTIEEAYEVADAIRENDYDGLRGELGDLLLQVVFHAQMAEEEGLFAFDDVVAAITDKMLRRHPHVFGSDEERARGPEPGSWEAIKAGEREESDDPPDQGRPDVEPRAGQLLLGLGVADQQHTQRVDRPRRDDLVLRSGRCRAGVAGAEAGREARRTGGLRGLRLAGPEGRA